MLRLHLNWHPRVKLSSWRSEEQVPKQKGDGTICSWIGRYEIQVYAPLFFLMFHFSPTKLSRVLMSPSNSISPTFHFWWEPMFTPPPPDTAMVWVKALYFWRSSTTRLSTPPAPANARTCNQRKAHTGTRCEHYKEYFIFKIKVKAHFQSSKYLILVRLLT